MKKIFLVCFIMVTSFYIASSNSDSFNLQNLTTINTAFAESADDHCIDYNTRACYVSESVTLLNSDEKN